jgi:hypothetical protein
MKKSIIEFLLYLLGGVGLIIVYFLYQNPDIRPYIAGVFIIGLLILFFIQVKAWNDFFDKHKR